MLIDKLHIYTNVFEVSPNHSLVIRPHNLDYNNNPMSEAIAFKTYDDIPVPGQGAYNNDSGVNTTIHKGTLFVNFNPRKLIHGENYSGLTHSDFLSCLDSLQAHLENDVGVSFDLENAQISRIDLCRDIETEYSFEAYLAAINGLIVPSYMPSRAPIIDEGYWRMGNRSRVYVFYDKKRELREKQNVNPKSLGIAEKNIMRCEVRCLKGDSVRSFIGVDRVSDLMRPEAEAYLEGKYSDIILENLFGYDFPHLDHFGYIPLNERIGQIEKAGKRNALLFALASTSPYVTDMSQGEFISELDQTALTSGKKRQGKNNFVLLNAYNNRTVSLPTYGDLISELKEKFLDG